MQFRFAMILNSGLIFMATEIGFLSVDNEVYFDENKMESTG